MAKNTKANPAYPRTDLDLHIDTALSVAMRRDEFKSIGALDDVFKGAAQIVATFAMQAVNSDLDPYLLNEVTKNGHAEGRSVAGGVEGSIVDEPSSTLEKFCIRPNGQKYYFRPWGDRFTDVEVMQKARIASQFPLLYGPPGTGKTVMAEAAYGLDLITILGTGDTELSDLVGGYVQNLVGDYEWVDGPLIRAAEEGRPLLIDEIGIIDPKVLTVVYGLMDGRREYTVTANQSRGTVKSKDGFFVIGATNPNAPGVRLSEALLSRFTLHVEVGTDYNLARELGVDPQIVSMAKNMDLKVRAGESEWAPQFRELLAFRDVAAIFGQKFAISNLCAAAPENSRQEILSILAKNMGSKFSSARID